MLSQNRRITKEQKLEVQKTLSIQGSRLKLVSKLLHEEGSKVVLRDISNIKVSMKKNSPKDCLPDVVDILKKYDAIFEIKCNENQEFEALYFSTPSMYSVFRAWPEFNLIDGTYNLIRRGYPVILWNIVDGNGATEIVSVCIVVTETKENIFWFLEHVNNNHPEACKKIKSFMADKDFAVRTYLKEMFHVPVHICLFHTAKIFNRTITLANMNISEDEREHVLIILQKMMCSPNEAKYMELYEQLLETASKSVTDYFNENWHNCRSEWVTGFMTENNFLNETNNRTECLNDFHNNERNKALANFSKVPAYKISSDESLYQEAR